MTKHSTARAAMLAANVSLRPPRVRSMSGPNTGATTANGASVNMRYSSTLGRAWPLVALKNSVSARETVTNTSPATPIAYASARRANGGNVVDSSRGRASVPTRYPADLTPCARIVRPAAGGRPPLSADELPAYHSVMHPAGDEYAT